MTLDVGQERWSAPIAATRQQIDAMLTRADQLLRDIAQTQSDGQFIYAAPNGVIEENMYQTALRKLAELGYAMYNLLFYSADSAPETRTLGDALRRLSKDRPLRLRIESDRFRFPWALLYDCDALDLAHIDPESFWGFRHILDERLTPISTEPIIRPAENQTLQVYAVLGDLVDGYTAGVTPAAQWEQLGQLAKVTLHEVSQSEDALKLLRQADSPAQALYFGCDADQSRLQLTDGALSCDQLAIQVPLHLSPLAQAPLALLLGRRSAAWDPDLAQGLALHLLGRGVRAVLAVEGEPPAPFTSAFGVEFLRRFCAGGEPAGDLLLDMRRERLLRRRHVLGLMFSLYGHAGTMVVRT